MDAPMTAGSSLNRIENYLGEYPVAILPLLSGYRCVTGERIAMSGKLRPIPSEYVQSVLRKLPTGLDGEITTSTPELLNSDSKEKIPFVYNIYDCSAKEVRNFPWKERLEYANFSVRTFCEGYPDLADHITLCPYKLPFNRQELLRDFDDVKTGNGAVIRNLEAPYEDGKSKSIILVNTYSYSEATVLGVTQEHYGTGLKTVPRELWGQPKERASSLRCLWDEKGAEFNLQGGLKSKDKEWIWVDRESLVGEKVFFKYLNSGSSSEPRRPVYLGVVTHG